MPTERRYADRNCESGIPDHEISEYMESYFINFHPALPILHQPSTSPGRTPPAMLKVIVAIGCLYKGRRKSSQDCENLRRLGQGLWRSGGYELEKFVSSQMLSRDNVLNVHFQGH
jgi:hypothetical protein